MGVRRRPDPDSGNRDVGRATRRHDAHRAAERHPRIRVMRRMSARWRMRDAAVGARHDRASASSRMDSRNLTPGPPVMPGMSSTTSPPAIPGGDTGYGPATSTAPSTPVTSNPAPSVPSTPAPSTSTDIPSQPATTPVQPSATVGTSTPAPDILPVTSGPTTAGVLMMVGGALILVGVVIFAMLRIGRRGRRGRRW